MQLNNHLSTYNITISFCFLLLTISLHGVRPNAQSTARDNQQFASNFVAFLKNNNIISSFDHQLSKDITTNLQPLANATPEKKIDAALDTYVEHVAHQTYTLLRQLLEQKHVENAPYKAEYYTLCIKNNLKAKILQLRTIYKIQSFDEIPADILLSEQDLSAQLIAIVEQEKAAQLAFVLSFTPYEQRAPLLPGTIYRQ